MKILIVGPSWVGDMVMAQTLFISLKQQYPDAQIDVLAPDWTRPLLTRMPEVSNAIDMPIGHGKLNIKGRWRLAKLIGQQSYTQAIVLPNSFKSALIPWFANIPLRTGWRGEARSWILNDCRKLDKEKYPLMQQRYGALAYPKDTNLAEKLPNPSLLSSEEDVIKLKEKLSLKMARPILVLCPGAEFGLSKKWPEEHYAKLADDSIREGRQVWILGSKNDQQCAENIINTLPAKLKPFCEDFTGKTALGEAIDLISLAQTVVTNDSGLMHVAAALAKPLVVIYGSTSPAFTPPLAKRVKILSLSLPCQPCFKRECPLGHIACLKELKPEQALNAIAEISQQEV